jgi:hypothetical protein
MPNKGYTAEQVINKLRPRSTSDQKAPAPETVSLSGVSAGTKELSLCDWSKEWG